jgi:hypothetical protein
LLGLFLRFPRICGKLRSYSWAPRADTRVGVDDVLLVGRVNVQENHWACVILVVCLRASFQGLKDPDLQRPSQVCESYPGIEGHPCCSLGPFWVQIRV